MDNDNLGGVIGSITTIIIVITVIYELLMASIVAAGVVILLIVWLVSWLIKKAKHEDNDEDDDDDDEQPLVQETVDNLPPVEHIVDSNGPTRMEVHNMINDPSIPAVNRNALRIAQALVDRGCGGHNGNFMAANSFSAVGLKQHLIIQHHDNYGAKDDDESYDAADFAVKNVCADWNQQAVKEINALRATGLSDDQIPFRLEFKDYLPAQSEAAMKECHVKYKASDVFYSVYPY